jgi:two-component system phosphate regulon sensor histidine kinase PhoR
MAQRRIGSGLFLSYLAVILVGAVAGAWLALRGGMEPAAASLLERSLLLAVAAATGVALLFSWRFERTMARPLRDLASAARVIGEGRFVVPPSLGRDDELGELGDALGELSRRLGARVELLVAESARLRSVLGGMSEGVALVSGGRIAFANPAFARLLDAAGSLDGQTPLEAVRRPELAAAIDEATAAQRLSTPGQGRDFDGPRGRTLHLRAAPLAASQAVVVVLLDVTEARSLERMRREFVANASHELRTPVAAIRAVVETLESAQGMAPEQRARFDRMLSAQVERLSRLVNDLLDLSRAEAAGQRFQAVRLELAEPLEQALAMVRARAEAKGQKVIDATRPGLPALLGDPIAVEQVLTNLLDNAVKYTPEGGRIEVRAAAVEDKVKIEVADSGPGISAEHLPRLFERFYRVDPARSRALGGTGLGLAIVKHLVQAQGGEVGVRSTPGVGTVFHVTLPAA